MSAATPTLEIRTSRLPLTVLLLASTLTVMAGAIVSPVLELIRGDLGVQGTAAGLIGTAHGLTIAAASPLAGWMIDRWGVRAPLIGGLIVYGLAGGAGVVTESYEALLASRFIFGLGAAAVFAGTTVALMEFYRGAELDRVMGWRSSAISLGGILWPILAGAVGGMSWHAPFAIYLIGVPLGVFAVLSLPNTAPAPPKERAEVSMWTLLTPGLLGLYGLLFATSILLMGIGVFLPLRLAEVGVTDPLIVAIIGVSISVAMTLVGLVYAKLRAGLGYTRLLRVTGLTWTAAFLIVGVVDEPYLMAVALALFGIGTGIAIPALTVLIGERVPAALRGQALAATGTATFLGQFLSPLVLGPIIDATTIKTGYLVAAAFSAVILAALLLVRLAEQPAEDNDRTGEADETPETEEART
ncbi:MFS transporter [Saccharomonospora sp. CUA-673]|uniref:MFS transporter n=1 Tax=Saccharomonospora sp. CUA-673 TaxID=1904969 RepID=UPI00095D86D6|nr:MFS transporter [Saccharomonospora sp. CUA-673]OLT48981.1 MFS transporter [Saccharomonospora sp. CUA-673]